MRAFHDSRNNRYRFPYGAVTPNTTVTLHIDVCDSPNARVALRTWVDGEGERRYEMEPAELADGAVTALSEGASTPLRFSATLTPETPGIVWYQFIISDEQGREQRYGARDGAFGGEGQLYDWEPPSFQLSVQAESPQDASGADNRFAEALIGFLRNEKTAHELAETIEAVRENQLPEARGNALDLMASTTREQLLYQLAGLECPAESKGEADDEAARLELDGGKLGLAKGRLWCASLVQMLTGDVPAAYRDEASCAETVSLWSKVDADCGTIMQNAIDLRRELPLFAQGDISCFAVNDDVFGFWRRDGKGASTCILVNASLQNACDVAVPLVGDGVSEVIAGYDAPIVDAHEAAGMLRVGADADRYARIHLYQLGTAIAYIHPGQRLERTMQPGLGVLAHITSLPAKGQGTLGKPARTFVDWLAKAGVRYWQILPVNPTDEFGSPYAGISAFAGNVRLLEQDDTSPADLVARHPDEYREFCDRESSWLEPYACFMAIRERRRKGARWQAWPKKYRQFDPEIVRSDADLAPRAEAWRQSQFAFQIQWREIRSYANERGIELVGDMPIYVSADSSDVWANPEMFLLDPDGKPKVVAGCPPDQFATEGQIWGNPIYDWAHLADHGYDWWLQRLKRAFELYDWVRLDHFIGFSRYFSIPVGAKATEGSYHKGPGLDLFHAAFDAFGPLPIIAEDLGSITPAVRALGAACGFPGMDIVQFVDGNDPLSGYRPRPEKIAFTGTHDNQTLVGYCETRYPDLDPIESAERLLELVVTCDAPVSIVPLQDVMLLDDEARMNVPGVAEGNWVWQAKEAAMQKALSRLKNLVALRNRQV